MSTTKDVYWIHHVNGAWTSNPATEVRSYSFDFSGLTYKKHTNIIVIMKWHNGTSAAETRTFKISFKNTDGTNATGEYTASVSIPAGETTKELSFSVDNAALSAKPITYNTYIVAGSSTIWAYVPVIKDITRTYTLTLPTAGDIIYHSTLKQFATWANMTTVNHTTTNTTIMASESNRPWGTSANLRKENGTSVTTDSSLAKTAGTKIEASWINTTAYALFDARNWSQ